MNQRLSTELAATLAKLAQFSPTLMGEIVSKLEAIQPQPFLADDVTEALKSGEPDEVLAQELADSVLQLYWGLIQSKQSVAEFAADLVNSPDLPSGIDKDELCGRLAMILSVRGLYVGQNALSLIYDNERVFAGARVISDLRPVLGPDIDEGVAGAIIIHTLKLDYQHVAGAGEFYLTLTLEDIELLSKALGRAKDKDAKLRTAFTAPFFSADPLK